MDEELQVSFSLDLKSPGWLDTKIQAKGKIIAISVSYLHDSVSHFVKGLTKLITDPDDLQRISCETEPLEFDFIFSRSADEARLEILGYDLTEYPDLEDPNFPDDPYSLLTVTGTVKSIVIPFWSALKELQKTKRFKKYWGFAYPREEMELLTKLVIDL